MATLLIIRHPCPGALLSHVQVALLGQQLNSLRHSESDEVNVRAQLRYDQPLHPDHEDDPALERLASVMNETGSPSR
jgi:hypothetical protein